MQSSLGRGFVVTVFPVYFAASFVLAQSSAVVPLPSTTAAETARELILYPAAGFVRDSDKPRLSTDQLEAAIAQRANDLHSGITISQ